MASKGKKVQEHHRSADFAEPCEWESHATIRNAIITGATTMGDNFITRLN